MIDPYNKKTASLCSNEFFVDRRVYVPAGESEALIERTSNYISKLKKNPLILDVGTGCGAVGISLAKKFPNAQVIGLDISEDALDVAEINIKKHNIKNYTIRLSDYVRSVSEEPDVIISDLPWGSEEYLLGRNAKVDWKKMPKIGFFPPDGDPMGCYKQLVKQILEKNWKTKLFIETGVMPKKLVESSLQGPMKINYIQINKDYSITEIDFLGNSKIDGPQGHYQLLYYAEIPQKRVREIDNQKVLTNMLYKTLVQSDMHCLIQPVLKRSNRNAWTGLMGIVTSHVAFHLWTDKYGPHGKPGIEFDIYSCKKFDTNKMVKFLDEFLDAKKSSYKYLDRDLTLK
jgi:HemK-like putative methylase